MHVVRADHFVLTVTDVSTTVAWYVRTLGMRHVRFGGNRQALVFGQQKLNLHQAGRELEPRAARPVPGSADFCLVSGAQLDDVRAHLFRCGVPIEEGPVSRTGATGPITSLYVRDPDDNLIEIATYDSGRPRAADPYDLLPPLPSFDLVSDDIADDVPLSGRHLHPSADGLYESPSLRWRGMPGAAGYAVTCFDPDAPTGSGLWHWFLYNLPGTCRALPPGAGRGDGAHLPPGGRHLRNDFGTHAYAGAAPPPGDGPHRYLFAVHALDCAVLEIGDDASAGYGGLRLTRHAVGRAVIRPTCSAPCAPRP